MATFVDMNIIKHTLSALAAAAIAVSCTIGTIDNKQLVTREFTATLSPQTRTSLADGGKVKKLIYQTPWWKEDGSFGGLIEYSIEIPFEMPHFVRQPKPQQ